jgi:hypothetical protein
MTQIDIRIPYVFEFHFNNILSFKPNPSGGHFLPIVPIDIIVFLAIMHTLRFQTGDRRQNILNSMGTAHDLNNMAGFCELRNELSGSIRQEIV